MNELWYALKVKSNAEWVVATNLRNKGYEKFLPIYRKTRQWSDRTKTLDAPLFPGYLFCRFDVTARLPILKVPGVQSIVGIAGKPEPIREEELEAVRVVVHSGARYQPYPYVTVGQRVRVKEGALYGLTGCIVKIKNETRLVISVDMLMRSVAVEIDRGSVEPE